ncbi:MAG: alkaline phosphatase family protein, partial [Bacillota bacterium]
RFTQKPLIERGLTAQSVLPVPAFYTEMRHRSLTLLPRAIVDTAYATYSRGYTPGLGYASISQAVDAIADFLKQQSDPTHIHLYIPDIDSACHKRGVGDPYIFSLTQQIDAQIARLAGMVPKNTRIVITADHGLIDVPPSNHLPIFQGDPLLELLEAPPSGDARMPLFHVRPGARQAFVDLFQQRYAHSFVLVSIDEAEEMGMFGPRPWNPVAKRRFGDFVGIAIRPATLLYHPPVLPTSVTRQIYFAQHAGLSPDEMYIPVIIA